MSPSGVQGGVSGGGLTWPPEALTAPSVDDRGFTHTRSPVA